MYRYTKLDKLGEGAHGVVMRARVRQPEEIREARRQIKREERERDRITTAEEEEKETRSGTQIKRELMPPLPLSVSLTRNTPTKRKLEESAAAEAIKNNEAEEEEEEEEDIQLPAAPDTLVAIKKIRLRSASEGLSMEAIREIKLLGELHHPHVLPLLDIFNHHSNINLVLECMSGDLECLLRQLNAAGRPLPPADVKSYMRMILSGMEHCHENFIVHRDMKPGNILIGKEGEAKIADFGLAKLYGSPDRRMSPQACTIWYRAPELLFGATSYGAAADMWSIGAIMGEMCWMKPMFAGPESEVQQLQRIFALLGTPSLTDWPHLNQLRHYIHFKPQSGHSMRELFPALTDDATELLSGLLTLNPNKRLTATEALNHRYFREQPMPTPPQQLTKIGGKEKATKPHIERAGKTAGRALNFDTP